MTTIVEKIKGLTADQQKYMTWLFDTMPLSDRAYPFELLLSVVDHSLMVRKEAAWCRALPEEMFREYVMYHRVNDEDISNPRPTFFHELWDRVKNLSESEAVLEVNRWCHEKATYQEQDDRTASPATVYRSGSGRCGEESAFAVTALRSVGIAARQIYAPRWSHCDDNHAWVEAYCGGEWHFFGACEPEPVLDKGWFNTAASRAMIVHSRTFGPSEPSAPDAAPPEALTGSGRFDAVRLVGQEGSVSYWNQTKRYANTKRWVFQAVKGGSAIGAGGVLRLSVLNESRFMAIAELTLDEDGQAAIDMGIGDVLAEVLYQGRRTELLCKGNEFCEFTIELDSMPDTEPAAPNCRWTDFEFLAPTGAGRTAPPLNAEQKRARLATAQNGNALRTVRLNCFAEEGRAALQGLSGCEALKEATLEELEEIISLARGNWPELIKFLKQGKEPERVQLLQQLSDKDYRDITADTLEDHLQAVLIDQHVAGKVFCAQEPGGAGRCSQEVFCQAVLNPRIADERLTPWRSALQALVGETQAALFRQHPGSVADFLKGRVKVVEEGIYPKLYFDPVFALENGRCDQKSLKVLAAALLRSSGVAARLSKKDQSLEYYDVASGEYREVLWRDWTADTVVESAGSCNMAENKPAAGFTEDMTVKSEAGAASTLSPARLTLKKGEKQEFAYRQNWSLSRLEAGRWLWLDLTEESFQKDELRLTLPHGTYRILTANRLPKGDQLASGCTFTLHPGGEQTILMRLRNYSVKDMLGEYPLPLFSACDEAGRTIDSRQLTASRPLLLFWLEEGAEPTEHVVNEWLSHLAEDGGHDGVTEADVVFLLRDETAKRQRTLAKLLDMWKEVRILYGDWEFNMELMARHLSCNPEQPPLAVVVNSQGKCVYGSSGYNVGLVKLLLEIAKLTTQK